MTWFELANLLFSISIWLVVFGLGFWHSYQRRITAEQYERRTQDYNQLVEAYCEQSTMLQASKNELLNCRANVEALQKELDEASALADAAVEGMGKACDLAAINLRRAALSERRLSAATRRATKERQKRISRAFRYAGHVSDARSLQARDAADTSFWLARMLAENHRCLAAATLKSVDMPIRKSSLRSYFPVVRDCAPYPLP